MKIATALQTNRYGMAIVQALVHPSVASFLGSISRRTFLGLPIATRLSRGPTGDCMLSECLRIVACQCKISCIVFANLPHYLSNALENIQKGALSIIVPSMPYSQAC